MDYTLPLTYRAIAMTILITMTRPITMTTTTPWP